VSTDAAELNEARVAYFARWDAVETVKAQELASLTDEQAREIMQKLTAVELWRPRPDWSGLVEQQALLHSRLGS